MWNGGCFRERTGTWDDPIAARATSQQRGIEDYCIPVRVPADDYRPHWGNLRRSQTYQAWKLGDWKTSEEELWVWWKSLRRGHSSGRDSAVWGTDQMANGQWQSQMGLTRGVARKINTAHYTKELRFLPWGEWESFQASWSENWHS